MPHYLRGTVKNIIENINDIYFLPDIQRDFVWTPLQIYTLFDSLLRNYPINTLLFWRLNGNYLEENKIKKLRFVSNSSDKNELDTSINREKEYFLVLDGQQRLTTFYIVLKGNYIIRNQQYDLYFNLLSGEEEDDGILYEFKFFNSNQGKKFVEKDKNGAIIKAWYRVKDIYAIEHIEDVSDIIYEEFEKCYQITVTKDQKKAVSRLLRMLKCDEIIYYYPETEEDYDKVLDIFVRTNSGGTKLSYSDLLFSTIKSQWKEAREKFDELITELNDNDRYDFSNDFILKTILFFNASDITSLRYKTRNFSRDVINEVQKDIYWKKLTEAIYLARDLLRDRFFLTHKKLVSSYNALIPIIYWLWKNNKKAIGSEHNCINENDISIMKTWFIKALLSGVFGGQSDTILYKCKEAIDKSQTISFPAEEIEKKIKNETKKDMEITQDDLDKIYYNTPNSHLVLSLIYKSAINFQPVLEANIPQQDHIFSQDELRKAGKKEDEINTIFNLRYVGRAENQLKSYKPFKEWIKNQSKEDKKMHLIPDGDWDTNNYSEFIKQRKEKIIDAFKY
jgi:uncharacterized protein with ParB-like and HNH nuclease domain